MTILLNITIEVDADGDYSPGSADTRTLDAPMGYPGDPDTIDNLKVTVSKSNRTVDLTDVLPTHVIEEIKEALISEHRYFGETNHESDEAS